jgi:ComF family protein
LFGGSVRQALHQLKYHRDITLGIIFLPHLERTLHRENWAIDLIVPVPLSRQRARQRGYNQSTFLAFPLALSMAIPFRPAALSRVRETTAQVGLSSHQRLKNVENAFAADEALVSNKIVLVVDDVTTTGATINACANALKKAGATKVYGLTLARSNWPDQAG